MVNILADEPDPPPYEAVAALKADLYAMLGRIERGACDMLSADDPAAAELRAAVDGIRSDDAVSTADAARAAAGALALSDAVGALDARLAALDGDFGAACRKRLIAAYIGFAWIDVLLLPLSDPDQPDPSQTVGVMRISPDDALSLEPGGRQQPSRASACSISGHSSVAPGAKTIICGDGCMAPSVWWTC
ncbi:hypothetical protein ACFQ4K_25690 [Tistrella bauzanensis]